MFDKTYYPEFLGMEGEQSATVLIVDVSSVLSVHPDARFSIVIVRADGQRYVAQAVIEPNESKNISYWLTNTDTSVEGPLSLQVHAAIEGYGEKSRIYSFIVAESLVSKEPINPDTLQEIIGYVDTAYGYMVAAQEAERDSQSAKADAFTNKNAAESARIDAQISAAQAIDACDRAESAMAIAQSASEKSEDARNYAESAYARLTGADLVVDVVSGELMLYSAGAEGALDIELNDLDLEVYQV